ncbi:MAG TPA: histidine kinase [Gammaproteobacteria bacterium]|nr:histidine kinase [Gammaproteobacteria bacterium]HIL94629.1 histidine kinase [Pseudomonadales bacterium]
MGFSRFSLLLSIRLLIIMGIVALAGTLITTPGYYAATLLAISLVIGLGFETLRFISRTNREVSRFLDAAWYADYGQRFEFKKLGSGFEELGDTFTHILENFRQNRTNQESEIRHLTTLLEHVPVPLISVHKNNQVTLWNNSSRRLFGAAVSRVSDLEQFGIEFFGQIQRIKPGEQRVASFIADKTIQQLKISASEITIASNAERLISLQNIQNELDGMQLTAWQDLVRVLTHEIMNSITPVTSLAQTAASLVEDARGKIKDDSEVSEVLADAKDAVDTVARRSDGLLNFVSSYRQLTRLPTPSMQRLKIKTLFDDVTRVATTNWLEKDIGLITHIEPDQLDINVDHQMIEQVLINLLKNSEQALEGIANGQVNLTAKLNLRGHIAIDVSDNGSGIPAEAAANIFVPFYTTRRDGSGVGLALSRQIMIAHGGTITFSNNEHGGVTFTLVF